MELVRKEGGKKTGAAPGQSEDQIPLHTSPQLSGGRIHSGRSDGGLGGGAVYRPPADQ